MTLIRFGLIAFLSTCALCSGIQPASAVSPSLAKQLAANGKFVLRSGRPPVAFRNGRSSGLREQCVQKSVDTGNFVSSVPGDEIAVLIHCAARRSGRPTGDVVVLLAATGRRVSFLANLETRIVSKDAREASILVAGKASRPGKSSPLFAVGRSSARSQGKIATITPLLTTGTYPRLRLRRGAARPITLTRLNTWMLKQAMGAKRYAAVLAAAKFKDIRQWKPKNGGFQLTPGGLRLRFKKGSCDTAGGSGHIDSVIYADVFSVTRGMEAIVSLSYEGTLEAKEPSNDNGTTIVVVGLVNGIPKTVASHTYSKYGNAEHVESVSLVGGLIRVQGLKAGPSDASCCPSWRHDTLYRVVGRGNRGKFKLVSKRKTKAK